MPTITFTTDSWDGIEGGASAASGRDLMRVVEYTTDDPAATSVPTVVNAAGTQLNLYIGRPHPDYALCRCVTIKSKADPEDPHYGTLTADFKEPKVPPGALWGGAPPPPGVPPPPGPAEPADQPPVISIDARKLPQYYRADLDDKPYLNTANDPMEDVPPRNDNLGVIQFSRKFDAWSTATSVFAAGSVNLAAWNGYAADTLLLEACPAKSVTERGRSFWEVSFTIVYNPKKWIPTKLLSAGRTEFIVKAGVVTVEKGKILDYYGNEKPGLSLLSAAGNHTVRDAAGVITGFVTTPAYVLFRDYNRISFAFLDA